MELPWEGAAMEVGLCHSVFNNLWYLRCSQEPLRSLNEDRQIAGNVLDRSCMKSINAHTVNHKHSTAKSS